jgi:hypothetical protein
MTTRRYEMRTIILLAFSIGVAITPLAALAQTKSFSGTYTKIAGSINPPNPNESCDIAKQHATDNAAKAGYSGPVTWDKLSTDKDCKLHTTSLGKAGISYTFTATGTFAKAATRVPLTD